jgi:hypothetical protein
MHLKYNQTNFKINRNNMKTGLKALPNQILFLITEDFNKPLNLVLHLQVVYIFLVTIRGLSKSPLIQDILRNWVIYLSVSSDLRIRISGRLNNNGRYNKRQY